MIFNSICSLFKVNPFGNKKSGHSKPQLNAFEISILQEQNSIIISNTYYQQNNNNKKFK